MLGANAAAVGRSNEHESARNEMGGGWVPRRIPALLPAHRGIQLSAPRAEAPHQGDTPHGVAASTTRGDEYSVARSAHRIAGPLGGAGAGNALHS